MKGRRALALLVLAVIAGALLAVFAIQERTPPRSPTEQVPVIWQTAREAPMHVFHVGEKKIACVECHTSPDAAPDETACAKCHAAETKTAHRGAGDATTTCLSCHAFGAGGPPKTCNACHATATRVAAAPALEHHAGAELPCGACHSVHGSERAVLSDCTVCHGETSAVHGSLAAHAQERSVDASMDLSLDAAVLAFLREAGAPVGRDAAAEQSVAGRGADLVAADPRAALPGQVCGACHAPHAGKEAARGTCEGCHVAAHRADRGSSRDAPSPALASRAPEIAPRGRRVAGHEACVTCHEPHRARRADVRACEGCHADRRAASNVSGHAACAGCHAPHAPAEAKASCSTSCHANVSTLAAPRVAAHAVCTSCHDPHRPEVSAGQACAGCHASTKPSHPAIGSAKGPQACVGCHAPHPGRGASSGGGAAAHGARAPSSGTSPHGATAAACTSCHTNASGDHALHGKGTACTSCHAPHGFRLAGAGASLCAKCHAKETKATATRPGHASCSGCHGDAHAPNAKPACKSCHVEEAKTAPAGHAACTSCHEAHSGALGSRASCTSCHANKATALHANVAQGCATCHRPHGPKGVARPAACASCHSKPSLPGLHSITAHGACETCHGAHAPPRSDRATCTGSCHAGQRNHQPEAKVCKGCHIFRR